jgi:Fe-S oxidoreductase
MTAVKLEYADAAEADILVSADPGCIMQMRGLANGRRIEHLATILNQTQNEPI